MARHIVLFCENQHGEPKWVLVPEDQYEGSPGDYFTPGFTEDAKVPPERSGTCTITSSTNDFDSTTFESEGL